MKIGIDARLYSQTGIGRYIRNLIQALSLLDRANEYVVFLLSSDYRKFKLPNKNWSKFKADVPWHSLSEQIKMPYILYRHRLDLVHFPYFNIPMLYLKPFVVTIHDLTIWQQPTGKATTRPLWYYFIKKIGYMIELYYIAKKAKHVITISQSVKKDIKKVLGLAGQRITVIYEAVDRQLLKNRAKPLVSGRYALVVGNFYPHKNLQRLIFAWKKVISHKHHEQTKLILVGPKDFFYKRLHKQLQEQKMLGKIQFVLNPGDAGLATLYKKAQFLVFPSLAEGFGLPGLEAMALGCPVICSDLPVFKEIYGEAPLYFDPQNIDSMVKVIEKGMTLAVRPRLSMIKRGQKQVSRYSWEQCARQTMQIYENCLNI